ncbi:MAG: ABC transporter permease [Betaproteobacteria bacterium HGW-Betaproteobacteria-21]|nr:MAG: ABC transporter permease [Betaproteobacteria bacterium HGW-Betaproteobacteria-21]
MFAASLGALEQTLLLASRNLLRQRRRAALALLIICGGVITFLLAGGFINWVLESMRESTIHSQLGHVQITRPGYLREGLGDPYRYLLPADTGAARENAPASLRTLAPRLSFNGLLSKGDDTISFIGEGVDPVLEAPIAKAITIAEGRSLEESPVDSVLLGVGLAANISARPGDTVVLLGTTAEGGINAVELTVAGLFATTTKAYDDTALRVPIEVARRLMRVEGATSWVLLLDQTEQTDDVVAELRQRLPADQFEVIPWSDLADFYNKTVVLFSQQVGVIRILIALIVVLSISNTLTMAVIERTAEIGTSMAIGVRRSGILSQFVLEGALLGLAGGLIGVALGLIVGTLVSIIGIPMPPPPGMAMGFIGEISISPKLALDGFLLAFLTTLLASIFPAWKASRMIIVDALRHQR